MVTRYCPKGKIQCKHAEPHQDYGVLCCHPKIASALGGESVSISGVTVGDDLRNGTGTWNKKIPIRSMVSFLAYIKDKGYTL